MAKHTSTKIIATENSFGIGKPKKHECDGINAIANNETSFWIGNGGNKKRCLF